MTRSALYRPILVLALTAGLTACRAGGTAMFDTEPLEPGAECAEGGIRLTTGVDEDGDGALSADEIEESVVLCDGATGEDGSDGDDGSAGDDGETGADGFTSLVRTEALPSGDPDCPAGGTRVSLGLDNGDGGDTAADGALGDGEVDSTELICNGQSSIYTDSTQAPGGDAGVATLNSNGGDATDDGGAGRGGKIYLANGYSNAGHIKVFATGAVDAGFDLPTRVNDFGPNPLVLSGEVDIPAVDFSGEVLPLLNEGELFYSMEGERGQLATWVGGEAQVASGLHIEAGAVVTITDADDDLFIFLENDVVIDGTLTVSEDDREDLLVVGASVWVGPDGLVDLSGAEDASNRSLRISTANEDWGLVVIEGTLDVSGYESDSAGDAIGLGGGGGVYVTGQLLGTGSPDGSDGGELIFRTGLQGTVNIDGLIDFSGGDADDGSGGDGGNVSMDRDGRGAVRLAGTFDLSGGDGTNGDGGDGGTAELYSAAAPFTTSASFDLSGGESNSDDGDEGGDGGTLSLRSTPEEDGMVGRLDMSGSINASGGTGPEGGNGGSIHIASDSQSNGVAPVALYGYAAFEADGGDALASGSSGGDGGSIGMYHDGGDLVAPGGVFNQAALHASGGDSSDDRSGDGGWVSLVCESGSSMRTCFVHQEAEVTVQNGENSGGLQGGPGGEFEPSFLVQSQSYYNQVGAVNLSGLEPSGDDHHGGQGNVGYIRVIDHVFWDGDLTVSGANSTGADSRGGSGGGLWLSATSMSWSGSIIANGGDGGLTDGEAGEGGHVQLMTSTGGSAVTIPTGTASAGAGNESSPDGMIVVDGVNITSSLTAP